eukprot:g730.t1
MFTFSAILTWILRDYADETFDWIPSLESCETRDGGQVENACFGKGIVLRLSFALFAFHLLHALFLIQCKFTEDSRTRLHTDCLGIRWSIWIGFVILSFFIPQEFYDGYGELTRFLAAVFLVFQALVLIDIIYKMNEAMLDRDECIAPLIIGAVVTFVLGVVFIGVAYGYYAPRASCSTNVFWITWTIILGVFVTLISISPWRIDKAGLFTSGVVFAYCSFLLLAALNNQPRNACVDHGGVGTTWLQVIGFILALGAVMLSTLSVGTADITEESPYGESLPYRPDYFHLIFALASAYVAMLFTNWDLNDVGEDLSIDKGWTSAWIKIITQWFTFLLYGWTLVAPSILSDRDFS